MLDALRRRTSETKRDTDDKTVVVPNLRGHIAALDGIRGAAILVVLLHHSNHSEYADSIVLKVMQRFFAAGWVGVDLFFVLSGFLITGILSDAKGRTGYFTKFYMRRILRIFPLYYGAVALMLFVFPYLFPGHENAHAVLRKSQVWYWTYLNNYATALVFKGWPPYGSSHFWSLAVEEQFYFVWPFLVYVLSRRTALYFSIALVAIAPLYRVLCLTMLPPLPFNGTMTGRLIGNYVFLPGRMDTLAIGATIALLARQKGSLIPLLLPSRRILPWSLVILAVLALANHGVLSWTNAPTQVIGFSALGLAFGSFLVIGAASGHNTRSQERCARRRESCLYWRELSSVLG